MKELEEAWKDLKSARGGRGWAAPLQGEVFGRLTVLSREGCNKQGKALWKCRCSCGGLKVTTGAMLKSGRVKSCGCLRAKKSPE